jgi:hypothetical protein
MPINPVQSIKDPEIASQERLEQVSDRYATKMHENLYDLYATGRTNAHALPNMLGDQEYYLDRREHEEAVKAKLDAHVRGQVIITPHDIERLTRYGMEADSIKDQMMNSANEARPYGNAFNVMFAVEKEYITEMEATDAEMFDRLGRYQYRHRLIEKTMDRMGYPKKPRPK